MKKVTPVFFAYSYWDIIPVLLGLLHLSYFIWMLMWFDRLPLWANLLSGLIYSFSISWNINSVSHNFIHNAYFKSFTLNRLFSLLESVTMCFSQTMYDYVHRQHHIGNNDRKDKNGDTVDWISIFRHGKDGQPESALRYTFLSYFRDDPQKIYGLIRKHSLWLANFAVFEVIVAFGIIVSLFMINWKLGIFYLFFYYLGHSVTAMNGYYEHLGSNPDKPIAWGVSCYNGLYNLTWLNNGYHAEHHYRPKQHWTKMHELHEKIKNEQLEAGVKIIKWPHQFGFMENLFKS
jgi:fatty acid desaturase